MNSATLISHGDLETVDIGKKISNFISKRTDPYPFLIFLSGELGSGKTTLCKGILKGLGHEGIVKSPTYNLVETYEISGFLIFHFDFYQISHPKELSNIGIKEYLDTNKGISIIEWPEKMISLLPNPDIEIKLNHSLNNENERSLEINSKNSIGLKKRG